MLFGLPVAPVIVIDKSPFECGIKKLKSTNVNEMIASFHRLSSDESQCYNTVESYHFSYSYISVPILYDVMGRVGQSEEVLTAAPFLPPGSVNW